MDFKALSDALFCDMTPRQKQYEVLRMLAKKEGSMDEIAKIFDYKKQSIRNLYKSFMAGELEFFPELKPGPKEKRTDPSIIDQILRLRRDKGYSIYDIKRFLIGKETPVSTPTINRILNESGYSKLNKRSFEELGKKRTHILASSRSSIIDFKTLPSFVVDIPVAGLFFFIPYIIESGILDIVCKYPMPSSSSIGKVNAALSILAMKLMGQERLSHIQTFDHEPSFGIFAGLNVLPKSRFMGSYSNRTNTKLIAQLQQEIIKNFRSKYSAFYNSDFINLDFHAIPHYGDEAEMEKVWAGAKGKRLRGANTLLAQDGSSDIVLYTSADILRKDESGEIMKFINYWKTVSGRIHETLVFDCRLTTYKILGTIDSCEPKIKFITLRKRNHKLLEHVATIDKSKWIKCSIKNPKRKNQKFLAYEEETTLSGCKMPFRQIIIKDHGREKPTFIVTNNPELKLNEIVRVYSERWHIESKIAELVAFFNLNALSSPIMIRIHFDLFWTIIADTLYHLLANDLKRFEKCRSQTIFKKFINYPGRLEYNGNEFIVKIRKRAHTPIILDLEKLNTSFCVPWLNNTPMRIEWTA